MLVFAKYADSIFEWLKSVQNPLNPGYFEICRQGGLVTPSPVQGLGMSCLAMKIAYTINAIDRFSSFEIDNWTDYIKSFQIPEGRFSGFFEDRGLSNAVDGIKYGPIHLKGPLAFIKNVSVRRAETRQACAALLCTGRCAEYPVKAIPQTPEDAIKYFHSFNWTKPWHAGSHFSHLVFFLKYNAENFNGRGTYDTIVSVLWNELEKFLNKDIGCWFRGHPSVSQKINGAMKILTAYSLTEKKPELPEKLIDFCLSINQLDDGCHILDVLYVLHYCAKYTEHRKKEIKQVAEQKLERTLDFYQEDGAFSFFPDRSQTHYYGQRISRGLCESDIHGTHLFTWAICLISEILLDFKKIPWNIPIT